MDFKSLKLEGGKLLKTLSAVVTSLGVIWTTYLEPVVEEYVHEQVQIVQEEDKALIQELREEVQKVKATSDSDYSHNKAQRNEIIDEIQYFYPQTRLKIE